MGWRQYFENADIQKPVTKVTKGPESDAENGVLSLLSLNSLYPQIHTVGELGTAPVSETEVNRAVIDAGIGILNRAGARQWLDRDRRHTIGLWSDRDSDEVRYAIGCLFPHSKVVHLEDAGVPMRYKVRQGPEPRGTSWSEYKADMINRAFDATGKSGRRARITAETVRQGEAAMRRAEEAEANHE